MTVGVQQQGLSRSFDTFGLQKILGSFGGKNRQ